jgi:hypothetical protein
LLSALEAGGLTEQAPEGIADDLAAARRKQVFGTGVEVADHELIVHQHHGRRQQLQAGKG